MRWRSYGKGKVMKIAFAEDDHALRRAFARAWKGRDDVEVKVFESAEEAMAAIDNGFVPDIIISDNDMGQGSTGLEFGDWARTMYPDTKFVLCSGSIDANIEAPKRGFGVISKPASISTIESYIGL
jgi:DNA-binding NtrC family response regulator